MSVIMVTGGAGFIGSAVIRYLIQHTDHIVVNIDKLTYAGNLDSLRFLSDNKHYNFEKVDICDSSALQRIFKEYMPAIVMHLAAESHVDRSIDGPAEFIRTNIVGTYTLLEEARRYYEHADNETKKQFMFHHISTDEVYGDLPHPDDCKGTLPLFTETTAYNPSSPYSASKASSDHVVRAWNRTYKLPVVITNCSNNYGPYQFPEKLVPLIILNAIEGKPLPVYGKGDQIRDWLYVEDHAKALVLVATSKKTGQTYNIGGHNERKNIDVVTTICSILDEQYPVSRNEKIQEKKLKITSYKDLIQYVADRPGHDRRYAIDAGKIQKELGWKPEETFESGLTKTVEWYLNNKWWWEPLRERYNRERLGVV